MAILYLKQKDYLNARKNAKLALELDKNNLKAVLRKSRANRLMENYDIAIKDLKFFYDKF